MFIHQNKFIYDLILEAGLENVEPLSLPVDINKKFSTINHSPLDNHVLYRKIIDKLLYLAISGSDIVILFHYLNKFLQSTSFIICLESAQIFQRYNISCHLFFCQF